MKGIQIIAPLILVIVLGMVLKYRGFLNHEDRDRLTRLLYWIIIPALLFRTTYLAGGELAQHKNLFLATYSSFLIVPVFALVVSFFTHRGNRQLQAFSAMAGARANNLYLGMPAAILALGDPGVDSVAIYMAICLPGYNLISILWGEVILSGGISLKMLYGMFMRIAKNPMIVFCLLGLAFAQLHIPVPDTLLVSMKLVGDMATGVALIALGMSLELPNLPQAFRRTWPDVAIKLFLHPAVAWACLMIWPVSDMLFKTAIIISAMPTAVNTFILAGGMGMDEQYACETVAITTVLAPISIPIWVALLGIG